MSSKKNLGTGGAVRVINERGAVSMQKVKVQRYRPKKAPEFAKDVPSDEEDDFVTERLGLATKPAPLDNIQIETSGGAPQVTAEILEESDSENDSAPKPVVAEILEEESSDEESEDEAEVAARRARLLARRRAEEKDREEEEEETTRAAEQAALASPSLRTTKSKANVSSSESESSSEYTDSDSSDSDEDGRKMFKPVFVSKSKRVTKLEEEERKKLEQERLKAVFEREQELIRQAHAAVQSTIQAELQEEYDATLMTVVDDDDDNVNEEEEYELWKVRELKRMQRDLEEREKSDKEKMEVDRVHEMTDRERRDYFKANPKMVTNKGDRGKMKYLQKYWHRGAFFMDEHDELFTRDFSAPTLDDHFDKSVLPQVMQVKKFGMIGNTKYTHLADQDTSQKGAWGQGAKSRSQPQTQGNATFARPSGKRTGDKH
eukprot:m.86428 g.86428  ORF g.86428 m.86428 type:complete len:432 (+) comp12807_c0_seq2:147-1442(+)